MKKQYGKVHRSQEPALSRRNHSGPFIALGTRLVKRRCLPGLVVKSRRRDKIIDGDNNSD